MYIPLHLQKFGDFPPTTEEPDIDERLSFYMTTQQIQRAESQTHEHILSIVHTETSHFEVGHKVRLLDVGCGNGHLTAYLLENLPVLNPGLTFEIFGFDVDDHGVQHQGYFEESLRFLTSRFPETVWKNHLALIPSTARWPYPDEYFDVIFSNQVIEHVNDHRAFFSEIHRTLRPEGVSVHIFPLKHQILESHLWLPWVQHIKDYNLLRSTIKWLSRLGLGKYRTFKRHFHMPLDEFSERHADFLVHYTNYLCVGEVLTLAKRHQLRASFQYTQEYYFRKIMALLGRKPAFTYARNRASFADSVGVFFLKYISSVTLFLKKKDIFSSPIQKDAF